MTTTMTSTKSATKTTMTKTITLNENKQRRRQISRTTKKSNNNRQQRRRRIYSTSSVAMNSNKNDANSTIDDDEDGSVMISKREILLKSSIGGFISSSLFFNAREVQADVDEDDERTPINTRTDEREQKMSIMPDMMRDKRTVLITGSNSGIGFAAAKKFAKTNEFKVILACRTLDKAKKAKNEIIKAIEDEEGGFVKDKSLLVEAECDLGDLTSIKTFAESLGDEPIDLLCLNAGVQFAGSKEVNRTKDGFEQSMGVDHLGHFLLTNLLLPNVESAAKSSTKKPRIVITASEVHDPESPGGKVGRGAGLGNFEGIKDAGVDFDLMDGSEFDADKAYKDSKLANILFANELNRRLRLADSQINVVSFGPGLITRGSNFFQHTNPLFVKVFDFAANDLFHVAETVDGGGNCLLFMALSPDLENKSGIYYNNDLGGETGHTFHETLSSKESRNLDEARELWTWSEALVNQEFGVYRAL
jgi:protochlorophyllide reductase